MLPVTTSPSPVTGPWFLGDFVTKLGWDRGEQVGQAVLQSWASWSANPGVFGTAKAGVGLWSREECRVSCSSLCRMHPPHPAPALGRSATQCL